MHSAISNGTLLIAPHQFPHLEREQALADQFGLELVAAADQQAFTDGMTNAVIVMVTPYGKVNETEFSRMTRCKAVVRYGMGYDNIDVKTAKNLNIPVSIVPDASSEEVAAHALAMGIALARRLPQGQASIERGGWAGAIAYDIVTAPLDTAFLQEARAKGHRTIDGLSMLIGQAAVAFEKFFGQPAPRDGDADLRKILTQ